MKSYFMIILLFLGGFAVFGELSEDTLDRLEDLEIAGTRSDTDKDDDRNKIEVLEVNTFQSEDDDGTGFRIRMIVELTDKLKDRYLVDYKGNRPEGLDSEYTGEDYWKLYMPHGELERLKITAYVVQYGFMDGDEFRVFVEDYDGVKTVDELLARTSELFPERPRLKHYYMYEDSSEGEMESISRDVRRIK